MKVGELSGWKNSRLKAGKVIRPVETLDRKDDTTGDRKEVSREDGEDEDEDDETLRWE